MARDQRASVESAELRARLEAAEKTLMAERTEVEPLRRRLEATELALTMVCTTWLYTSYHIPLDFMI